MSAYRINDALYAGRDAAGIHDHIVGRPVGLVAGEPTRLEVVYRTTDNLVHWSLDSRPKSELSIPPVWEWSWERRPGVFADEVALARSADNSLLFVFGKGTDGQLWWNALRDGWPMGTRYSSRPWIEERPPSPFGAPTFLSSEPQTIVAPDGLVHVFCTVTPDRVATAYPAHGIVDPGDLTARWVGEPAWDGTVFPDRASIRPIIAPDSGGMITLLARGMDGHVWTSTQLIDGFGPWTQFDSAGVIGSDPVPAVAGSTAFIFARGMPEGSGARQLWFNTLDGSSGWTPLGGVLPYPHLSVASGGDWAYIGVRGLDDAIWLFMFNAAGRSAALSNLTEPGVAASDGSLLLFDALVLVFRGSEGDLWGSNFSR